MSTYLAGQLGLDTNNAEQMAQLRQFAGAGYGHVEQMVSRNPRTRYGSADRMIMAHRQEMLRGGASVEERAQIDSNLGAALSGLGQGPLRRIANAIIGGRGNTSIRDLISQTLGWIPEGATGQALEGTFRQLQTELQAYESAPGADARQRAANRRQALERIRVLVQALQTQGERANLRAGPQGVTNDMRGGLGALGTVATEMMGGGSSLTETAMMGALGSVARSIAPINSASNGGGGGGGGGGGQQHIHITGQLDLRTGNLNGRGRGGSA